MAFNFFTGLFLSFTLMILGCRRSATTEPIIPDDGYLIVDSGWVIDAYNYDSAACREVLAGQVSSAETFPVGSVAVVKVISTACYRVKIKVEDSAAKVVRIFEQQFAILNRKEGDKNRGVQGYLAWDGKDESGQAVPLARYLWRLEFDFGKGRFRRIRADIRLD